MHFQPVFSKIPYLDNYTWVGLYLDTNKVTCKCSVNSFWAGTHKEFYGMLE